MTIYFFNQLTNQTAFVDTLNAIIHRFAVNHRKRKDGKDEETDEDSGRGNELTLAFMIIVLLYFNLF